MYAIFFSWDRNVSISNPSVSRKVTIRSSLLTQAVNSACSLHASFIAYRASLSLCCFFSRLAAIPSVFAKAGFSCSLSINRIAIMRSFTFIDLPFLSLVCNYSIGNRRRNTGLVSQNKGAIFSISGELPFYSSTPYNYIKYI